MTAIVNELRDFARACLVDPVAPPPVESRSAVRRRRVVVGLTLVVGAALLAWALRIPAGDSRFYLATAALAAVWTVGAFGSGRLHLGRAHTRARTVTRPALQPVVLGAALLAIFLGGALVVSRIPALADPVRGLLDHADAGSIPLVVLITAVNGVAEELFFRGALFAALPRRWPVLGTTAVYALTTLGAGVPLLAFAGLVIGAVTALQRRVTGGVQAPIITHLVWSLGMLLLLPRLL